MLPISHSLFIVSVSYHVGATVSLRKCLNSVMGVSLGYMFMFISVIICKLLVPYVRRGS